MGADAVFVDTNILNLVATMVVYGLSCLLTHNVADFARFAAVVTVIPLQDERQP